MKKNDDKNNPGTTPSPIKKPKGPKPVIAGSAAYPKEDASEKWKTTKVRK